MFLLVWSYGTDRLSYIVEVTTLQFLSNLMKKYKSDFVPPGYPYIIVSKLTDKIIKAAIQSFINEKDDSYWLKLYYIPTSLKIKDLNDILDRKN